MHTPLYYILNLNLIKISKYMLESKKARYFIEPVQKYKKNYCTSQLGDSVKK